MSVKNPTRSDEQLIDQFLTGEREASERAFETLVKRHGPMVLGICRHILSRDQDAEDAFQATFLTLARKAGTIRDRQVLVCWLHEVAYRTALQARTRTNRRRLIERQAMALCGAGYALDDPDEPLSSGELRPVLYKEMNELPSKYGVLVVLGYMEGKTNQEVADLLKLPIGTVKGRLSRARDMLRARLSRRGVNPNVVRFGW
jgi:RNA polymerase sigma-70 factor (ECF subfamily)